MSEPVARWYALYTKPRNEKKVTLELSQRGYTVYLPLITTIRQWSDRKKKVQVPLFNSYIFIHTELEKTYYDILNTYGIVKFVKVGSQITPIRDEQINQIRMFIDYDAEIQLVAETRFELNQDVEIVAGPFSGMKGKLVEYRQSKCFAVEIEQLGANLLVSLPLHFMRQI